MAAGLIVVNVKDAAGGSKPVLMWADDVDTPTQLTPVSLQVDNQGNPASIIAVGSQASPPSTYLAAVIAGDIAHDASDSGNPAKIGAKAKSALSGLTLVSADDRANAHADLDGAIITRTGYCLGDLVKGVASNTDGTATQVIAAAGSGIKLYLKKATFANTSSSTITVDIVSGSTVIWTVPVPPGGCVENFVDPLPPNAANEALKFDPSAATSTITCSMLAFKSKV